MILKVLAGVVVALVLFVFVARTTTSVVNVERTFNAPLDKVWILWTDAEVMKGWWSPKDYTAPVIKSDFREGGSFLYSMRSPKGEMHWNAGTYTQIVAKEKIVQSMSFADENGNIVKGSAIPVPGVWPDFVTVTTEFKADGDRTHVAIREEGIPLIMKLFAKLGWEQQFDKFQKLL